jgi:hypothetical protein
MKYWDKSPKQGNVDKFIRDCNKLVLIILVIGLAERVHRVAAEARAAGGEFYT